jgi:hypothetical protein
MIKDVLVKFQKSLAKDQILGISFHLVAILPLSSHSAAAICRCKLQKNCTRC